MSEMNQDDERNLTNRWHRKTNELSAIIDDVAKDLQDEAYRLGLNRGRQESAEVIAALREQLELFRKFAQTVYVRHGEYVMRQYRLIDENGKPTKLLTGGRE